MATAKLQTTVKARAARIATENILPMLPDGRFVVISPSGSKSYSDSIKLTNTERCSCGAFRMQKAAAKKVPCLHMVAVIERAK